MPRFVFCQKLKEQAEGMDAPPFPGQLGEKLYNHISKQAWKMWLNHQTMLINEYRLSVLDPNAKTFLQQEMDKFFFGEGSATPADFKPKEKS